MNKFVKRVLTFLVVFEHCRCVEDLLANVVYIVRHGVLGNLVGASSAVVHDKLSYHSEVLVKGMLFVGQRLEVKRRFAREDVADCVISPASLPGKINNPITSIMPMDSCLILWSSALGWKIP